jgi:hypothetical protein
MLTQSKLLPDGALGILKELAASDKCLVGALNNEARETNEYRFDSSELRNYFKVALSSCYLGLRKPDRRFTSGRWIFWAGRRSGFCLSTTVKRMWREREVRGDEGDSSLARRGWEFAAWS